MALPFDSDSVMMMGMDENSGNKLTPAAADKIRVAADQILSQRPEDTNAANKFVRTYLLELREIACLTQVEAAQKARLSDSKLSLYENGLVDLSDEEERRLERVLRSALKGMPRLNISQLASGNYDAAENAARVAQWLHKKYAQRQNQIRRFRRKQVRMSQRELARATAIPRNKLSRWEAGAVELTPEEESRWEQVLRAAGREKRRSDPWWKLKVAHQAIEDLIEERRQWLPRLENLTRIDDPVINEIIDSFRREIVDLEAQLAAEKKSAKAES